MKQFLIVQQLEHDVGFWLHPFRRTNAIKYVLIVRITEDDCATNVTIISVTR